MRPQLAPALASACLGFTLAGSGAAEYPPPAGGWDYSLEGDAAAATSDAALDGSWDHNNSADQWDGTAPGTGNPGGVDTVPISGEPGNTALRVVDAVTVSGTNNNRRISLTHDLASNEGVAADFIDDGATLAFRLRVPGTAPDMPAGADGLNPATGAVGMINLRGSSGRASFTLGIAGKDSAFDADGLRISDGGNTRFVALDPTAWNEFWVTVVQNADDNSLHELKVYTNGGTIPIFADSVTLATSFIESYPYISIQLPTTGERAAVEIDYIAFKNGVHLPNNADGDALPDSWELAYFPDLSQDEEGDFDNDGATNGQEFNLGSNPTLVDSDGDELTDGAEFNQHGTDPTLDDTDGDGLKDGAEIDGTPPTDPTKADTDGDGLGDESELETFGTNPTLADSDGDGFDDGAEINSGSDPKDGDSTPSFPSLDDLLISEFMASNDSALADADGDFSDWIEIWNPTDTAIDLAGHFLTDDAAELARWELPAISLGPNEFIVVFASGKDRTNPAAELHTDFQLDRSSGSYIALTRSDGLGGFSTVSAYGLYPRQETDVSYGAYGAASPLAVGYFQTPTPGAPNGNEAVDGFVADTTFSIDRGYYSEPFTTTVTTATPGATLIYTIDGTEPSPTNGTPVPPTDAATAPTLDLQITTTTNLRAIATKPGFEPTNVDTHTYIFPASIFAQSNTTVPPHANWGHAGPDFQMDPDIINHSNPEVRPVHEDLLRVPTVSLTMDWDVMFGSNGIYIRGEGVDRPTSIEYINPEADVDAPNTAKGFQVDGTVRIVGGSSTNRWKSDKLSMRLKFSPDLRYPVFGEARTDRFDTLIVDNRLNNVWHYNPGSGAGPGQQARAQYTHDQFPADLHTLMGGLSPEGKHCLLYINGVLWGITELHERPDDNFAAEYLGGDNSEYDAMKHRTSTVVAGSATAYNNMLALSRQDMTDQANYEAVAEVLHIENFIAYMIANYYVGNTDWAHQNWYATYGRDRPGGKWYYHSWDPEHCMESTNENVTGKDNAGGPTEVFNNLMANPEFRLLFADRVHQHFHNDGVLTPENAAKAYMRRANAVDLVTRVESARWGDNGNTRTTNPYTRLDWLLNRDNLLGTAGGKSFADYFPRRTGIVLGQFRGRNWYPDTGAPDFAQHGGNVPAGYTLGIDSPDAGTIYYTLDGSDPRTPAAAAEVVEHVLVAEGATKRGMQPTDDSITATWFTEGFDDSSWPTGTLGAGYDSGKYNPLIDDAFDMAGSVSGSQDETFYLRWEFDVADPSLFDAMSIGVRTDDGWVAYLNGVEIARYNQNGAVGTPLPFDARATSSQSSENDAQEFIPTIVSQHVGLLKAGGNVLAVHGLNSSSGSSDMLIDAILTATEGIGGDAGGLSPNAISYSGPVALPNAEAIVKARVFSGSEWSPLTSATFLVDTVPADAGNLVISKIHYRPAPPSAEELAAGHNNRNDFEYVEFLNISDRALDLTGLSFTEGVDFDFDDGAFTALEAGARALLVENIGAFEFRHGAGLPVLGEFANGTNLANNGERLTLLAADSSVIRDFVYNDRAPWPTAANGDGLALALVDPFSNPDHALPENWQGSANAGGDPGSDARQSFAEWQSATGAGAATADGDGDRMTSIEEFVFGGNPNVSDARAHLPTVGVEQLDLGAGSQDFAMVDVRVNRAAGGAVGWVLETSTDAEVWEDGAPFVVLHSDTDLGDGTQLLRFRVTEAVAAPGSPARRLFRVRVTL